jgi:hypothetical protein
MLAMALWEHDQGKEIESIQSYGIDTSDPKHAQQRQSWAYWVAQCHGRGILTLGTMCDFMHEEEQDGGLHGLREEIGNVLEQLPYGQPTTDYTVSTFATPDYMHHAERLRAECVALGLGLYVHELPALERAEVMKAKPAAVMAALDMGKPVLMIDADDHLLKLPAVTDADLADCDFGRVRNCELDVIPTHLEISSCGAWYFPTPKGREFVAEYERITRDTVTHCEHRALHAAYYLMAAPCGSGDGVHYMRVKDFTKQMRGCIEVTPRAGKGRPVCRT